MRIAVTRDVYNALFICIQGASIIRMLQEMMGSEPFFDGISKYLLKYEWSTATTDDLWAELGQVRHDELPNLRLKIKTQLPPQQ